MSKGYSDMEELFRCLPDARAEEILLEKNMGLIWYVAQRMSKRICRLELEDLISLASIGMVKAIRTFDITKGIRFSTYAGRCMQNEILMFYRKEEKRKDDISLSTPVLTNTRYGDMGELEDFFFDERADTEGNALDLVDKQYITTGIGLLPEKERRVLELYYYSELTQEEIAKKMKFSQSYASRLKKKALKHLYDMYIDGTIHTEVSGKNNSGSVTREAMKQSSDEPLRLESTFVETKEQVVLEETNVCESYLVEDVKDESKEQGGAIMHTDFSDLGNGFSYSYVSNGRGSDKFALLRRMLCEIPSNPDVENEVKDSPHYILAELVKEQKEIYQKLISLKYYSRLKGKEVAEKLGIPLKYVYIKDTYIITRLHDKFISACPKYAQYVAQLSGSNSFSSSGNDNQTSANSKSLSIAQLGEIINQFIDRHYNRNEGLEDISRECGVDIVTLEHLESVTKVLLLGQKDYWIGMIEDIVNGKCDIPDDKLQLLMDFISGMSEEDIEKLNVDEKRLMFFKALFKKIG